LNRLWRDCRHGGIHTIILPTLDRLSRNVRIAENLFYDFERLGVRVLIADMPTYNSRDRKDVMLRQIREVIAEENRKVIIEKLWKGRQERVRRGLPAGGNGAYGYRREGKYIVQDALETACVQLIFELSRAGRSRSSIAAMLNERAAMRRNGRPWTQRQVTAVLSRHALYVAGVLRYGEATGQDQRLIVVAKDGR